MLARSAAGTSQPTSPQPTGQQASSSDSATIQRLRPLVAQANAQSQLNAKTKGRR